LHEFYIIKTLLIIVTFTMVGIVTWWLTFKYS